LEALEQQAIAIVEAAIKTKQLKPADRPIVELRIEGKVAFDRLDLDTRKLQQTLQAMTSALIFLLKYNVDSVAYESPLTDEASRLQVEQEVFTDLLSAHNTYKGRAAMLSTGLIELKDLYLQSRSEPELYDYVTGLLERGETGSAPEPVELLDGQDELSAVEPIPAAHLTA
jgi:DNA repair protein SbcD/Mre11